MFPQHQVDLFYSWILYCAVKKRKPEGKWPRCAARAEVAPALERAGRRGAGPPAEVSHGRSWLSLCGRPNATLRKLEL